jgi:hypothetical protein
MKPKAAKKRRNATIKPLRMRPVQTIFDETPLDTAAVAIIFPPDFSSDFHPTWSSPPPPLRRLNSAFCL